jgi:hypothetical protein
VPGIARLRRGVSLAAAQSALETFTRLFVAAHSSSYRLGPVKLTIVPLADDLVHDASRCSCSVHLRCSPWC